MRKPSVYPPRYDADALPPYPGDSVYTPADGPGELIISVHAKCVIAIILWIEIPNQVY